jgi:hypothetical protein
MFELLGLAVAVPFVLLADWLKFIKHLPPREQNLTRASHGAGLLVFAALALREIIRVQGIGGFARGLSAMPDDPGLWVPALLWAITVVWGLVWFLVGCRRAQGPRDGLLTTRAVVKSVVGFVAFFVAQGGLVPADWWGAFFIEMALFLGGIWCVVTGLTKFVLLMRGGGGNAAGLVGEQIQRTAIFWRVGRPRKF